LKFLFTCANVIHVTTDKYLRCWQGSPCLYKPSNVAECNNSIAEDVTKADVLEGRENLNLALMVLEFGESIKSANIIICSVYCLLILEKSGFKYLTRRESCTSIMLNHVSLLVIYWYWICFFKHWTLLTSCFRQSLLLFSWLNLNFDSY